MSAFDTGLSDAIARGLGLGLQRQQLEQNEIEGQRIETQRAFTREQLRQNQIQEMASRAAWQQLLQNEFPQPQQSGKMGPVPQVGQHYQPPFLDNGSMSKFTSSELQTIHGRVLDVRKQAMKRQEDEADRDRMRRAVTPLLDYISDPDERERIRGNLTAQAEGFTGTPFGKDDEKPTFTREQAMGALSPALRGVPGVTQENIGGLADLMAGGAPASIQELVLRRITDVRRNVSPGVARRLDMLEKKWENSEYDYDNYVAELKGDIRDWTPEQKRKATALAKRRLKSMGDYQNAIEEAEDGLRGGDTGMGPAPQSGAAPIDAAPDDSELGEAIGALGIDPVRVQNRQLTPEEAEKIKAYIRQKRGG